jgi:hypothetical protein
MGSRLAPSRKVLSLLRRMTMTKSFCQRGVPAWLWLCAAVLLGWLPVPGISEEPALLDGPQLQRPQWRLGDRWVVETATRPIQGGGPGPRPPVKIRWQFTVERREVRGEQAMLRVDVQCLTRAGRAPRVSLWVEEQTLSLRQVEARMPTGGGWATLTESYQWDSGPSAVLGPLTALPLDLPAFVNPNAKASGLFEYRAAARTLDAKDLSGPSFSFSVTQSVGPLPAARQAPLAEPIAKELGRGETVEVRLAGPDRQVTQIWQAQQPWPVYTLSGRTQSRLVEVHRAAK